MDEKPHRSRLGEAAALAVPIIIGNISHTVVSLVDTIMVSHLGRNPLAALGASSILFLVLFLVFSSLVQGVQVLCARRLGEQRVEETGRVLQNGLAVGLVLGAVATATGLALPDSLLPLFTSDEAPVAAPGDAAPTTPAQAAADAEETSRIGAAYLRWRWGGGMWLVILVFVFKGFFWGVGITRLDLAVSLVANVANVLFNWLFIFGNLGCPAMGAPGAGFASALANVLAVVIYAALAARREFRREYGTFGRLRLEGALARRILRLSLPRSVQGLGFGASAVFFAIIGNEVGVAGLAVSTVIWRFFGLLVLTGVGIGTAASTLVGRELGAGKPESARSYGHAAVRLGLMVTVVSGALCLLFGRSILGLFELDAAAIEEGLPVFRMMVCLQIIDVAGIVLSKALVGAGQVFYVMFAEILVSWAVCLPTCLLFLHLLRDTHPLLGAWLGWCAYILAWFGAMFFRWRQGSWMQTRV